MTTKAHVKRWLKPLLERRDDLVLIDRWIYLKPVTHLARTVLIDATSSRDFFMPKWSVQDLTSRIKYVNLGHGEWLFAGFGRRWNWDQLEMQSDLIGAIEQKALPALERLQTLDDFLRHVKMVPLPNWSAFDIHRFFPCMIAAGNLDLARQMAAVMQPFRIEDQPLYKTAEDFEPFLQVRRLLDPLADNDIPAMVAILREFEAYSVRTLKLEPYWQPTPFPLESMM